METKSKEAQTALRKTALFLLVILVTLGLVLAACKSNTPTPPTSQPPTTQTTTPPVTQTTTPPTTQTTTPPVTQTTTTAPSGPPKVPHALDAAHTDCLLCHKTGSTIAKPIPASHSSYTVSMCTACHQAQ
jgi:hypothetical protein